uniref:Chloroplast envelope membrane protein n=1 Tax=Anthurium amnicola TaxID=1678845 RepID=A0A1D1YPU7_9ARAE
MSTSVILSDSFAHLGRVAGKRDPLSRDSAIPMLLPTALKRKQHLKLVPSAKGSGGSRKRSWWQKLFSDDDADSWFSVSESDLLQDIQDINQDSDGKPSEEEKFEAWRKRAEAITDLREAQEDARNSDSRVWEDWLVHNSPGDNASSWGQEWDDGVQKNGAEISDDPDKPVSGDGFVGAIKDLILRNSDLDMLFEDRVFQYASTSSAKFLALLVLVPWAADFVVHDYVLMPFLDRYVKTVPLAAEMLDVRRHQKLEMIKALKVEKARFRFEVEIGKAPPLSDEEVWLELRHKAIELRDEWRLENRRAFANIWSDMVSGVTLFILIYFNQSKVALLKFTGYKIVNNISDTGKAFLIILITDIFLGYHSESGWQVLMEALIGHYGLEVDEAAITIFVCFVPVVIDACVKLWLFKILPRLSPNVANIFQEMKRH